MSCDLRASLLKCIDSVLGVKDKTGAILANVYIVTRTWSGTRVGDGTLSEVSTQVLPTPCIRDFSHDIRLSEAGAVKQGDLILTGISRNKFPDDHTLRTDTPERNVEKMWKVGNHRYRLINIKENFVTWDVHLRKVLSDEVDTRR